MFWKKKTNVVGDGWDLYDYTYGEGLRAFIRFDHDIATSPRPEGYDVCHTVLTHLSPDSCRPDGLPLPDLFSQLQEAEDELVALLESKRVDCKLVGVMTYGGYRDLVFQCAESRSFERHAEAWAAKQALPTEVRHIERGWEFFDEKVCPDVRQWQRIFDRRVIMALAEAGSDPHKPHEMEHFFKGPEPVLERIRDDLAARGFGGGEIREGGMMMTWRSTLDLDVISEITGHLRTWCPELGAEYDGWGAHIVE